jgi:cellulose synthase/poly-beta-1,6-N-acetylglucosamine synthase-like glycosyltransferase
MSNKDCVPWSVGIVVPAQNEQDSIEACVSSILASCRHAGLTEYFIAVVADSCSDETSTRASRALGASGTLIECNARSAGSARRIGVEAVLNFYTGRPSGRIWLANTDADTTVPLNWLTVQLQIADAGMAGVAGIVCLPPDGSTSARDLYLRTYLTAVDGTHSHVHGANLSMRADAYLDAGGWSQLALAEDHCLWTRLKGRGWPLSSTVDSVVTTSDRLQGRAVGGFADTLRLKLEAANVTA